MISIIISSVNRIFLAKVSQSIKDTIRIELEIIAISNPDGAFGVFEAYNKGVTYLLYCHKA